MLTAALISLSPVLTSAMMMIVTLEELVKESEVIAIGHVLARNDASTEGRGDTVLFQPDAVLKGKDLAGRGELPLCNPSGNSEWPDLGKIRGEYLVFLVTKNTCFPLAHGYRAVVRTSNGQAATGAIEGEPKKQSVERFLRTIRLLVKKQG